MNFKEQLETAKIDLIMTRGFFASCALRMEFIEDPKIPTACTNGIVIRINPQFFNRLDDQERVTLIAHEVLHIISLHHVRMGNRNPKVWNMAGDYAINQLLVDDKFKLPKGGWLDEDFRNKCAEEIYNILIQDPENQPDDGEDDGDGGGAAGFGDFEAPDIDKLDEMEQKAVQMAAQAADTAKIAGNLPSYMEEFVKEILEPKKSWRELLQKFVSEKAKNDYNWTRPNKRYMHMGLYLPQLESLEVGKIVMVIDTSGSINNHLLSQFIAEIQEIMIIFNMEVTVIQCDTEVKVDSIRELSADEEFGKIKGRGGTEFQPAFDYVNEHYPDAKALMYFTDGGCWGHYKEPLMPVIWAIGGNPRWKCDFGEIIYLD